MKKLFLFLCMALLSFTASAQYYETDAEAGDWSLGLNLNNGTRNPVLNFGLGGKIQYYATHAFRLEGSFNGFIERKNINFWDVNVNAHYVFFLKEGFSLYPIVGATFMHGHYDDGNESNREGCFGLNIGAGLQYDITEHLYVM
ncbi:MAG: porin family protein, partial [Bacteroidales bacterium]|nr:porin family protein [Bacteroidales bacterium]